MAVTVIVAFLISLISGLGIGGGGLFATYLAIFTELPQLTVQGLNLLFFLFSSGASVTVQLFRRKIMFTAVGIMALAGLVGSLLGTLCATFLPDHLLRRIFGIMLVSGGILSLKASMKERPKNSNHRPPK